MLKKTSVILLLLVFLLSVIPAFSSAEAAIGVGQPVECGHFSVVVPESWTVVDQSADTGMPCIFIYPALGVTNGCMMLMEYDFTSFASMVPSVMSEKDVCEAFATGILEIPEDSRGFTEQYIYNNIPCQVFDNGDTRWLITYRDGYVFAIAFLLDPSLDPADIYSTIRYQ